MRKGGSNTFLGTTSGSLVTFLFPELMLHVSAISSVYSDDLVHGYPIHELNRSFSYSPVVIRSYSHYNGYVLDNDMHEYLK